MKTDGIGNALEGLLRARDRLVSAAGKVSDGDASVEDIIETKMAARDVEANAKVIKVLDETEKKLLDELA